MANPTLTFSGDHDGVWLLPKVGGAVQDSASVFIVADSTPMEIPPSGTEYNPPSRSTKVVILHRVKGYEGSIRGDLVTEFSITATSWRDRFRTLLKNQGTYDSVGIITPHFQFDNIVLGRGYQIEPLNSITPAYSVSFSFISLDE